MSVACRQLNSVSTDPACSSAITCRQRAGRVAAGLVSGVLIAAVAIVTRPLVGMASENSVNAGSTSFTDEVMPLLRRHCIKCHGVSKKEGQLQLHTAVRIWKGGDSGPAVVGEHLDHSPLWLRVSNNEMPPENPLTEQEKQILKGWILQGAQGLPVDAADADSMAKDEHWAFTRLAAVSPPAVEYDAWCHTDIDRFIVKSLEKSSLHPAVLADRTTLIRRIAFTLTGLPPTPAEIDEFVRDSDSSAVAKMIERYLASEQYGVRWGRHWLDAAGYADSNGYFNADSDRPLAYRYRDYVVRSMNQDKPFDQFVREQIAGDELSGFIADVHRRDATPQMIDMLVATHFLRNGQDGSGESDGNPDEVRIDRYTALESSQQIIASSLLGLTFQCAKCHDHKFEPLTQKDFYQFQSVLFPAYNPDQWVKPNERVIHASLPGTYEKWEAEIAEANSRLGLLQEEFRTWSIANRLPELVQFHSDFSQTDQLTQQWTATIPGDDGPAGVATISLQGNSKLDDTVLPAASVADGRLQIREGGASGDKWLSTQQVFDWTPEEEGQWIQVSFFLSDTKIHPGQTSAERIAYGIALHDFDNNSDVPGGNLLIDGNPAGGAEVHLDYPGPMSSHVGHIGSIGYSSGKSFGLRVTRLASDKVRLNHIVNGLPESKAAELTVSDLPDGSFGFGYCCGRSYQVDDMVVEASFSSATEPGDQVVLQSYQSELERRHKEMTELTETIGRLKSSEPGRIAWLTDTAATPPEVFLLERGEYSLPKEPVSPAPISALNDEFNEFEVSAPANSLPSSGRRLAWANWVTRPDSRAASLMARVQVNRVWQYHFGTGLVSTPENLGMSGSEPSHPELLDWLASKFIQSGWSLKSLHRLILRSAVFQQSSESTEAAHLADPANRLLSHYPLRRLDAEAVRDAHLAISGDLDLALEGPYVPTTRNGAAEVIVPEDRPGAFRRSIYLQQRRSQGLSLLNVFDAPMMVTNCTRRPITTMPLQSLTLLNSDFAINRGRSFAARIHREAGDSAEDRVRLAFVLATGRVCSDEVLHETIEFLRQQTELYAPAADSENSDAVQRAWADFCQLLLASNECIYLE